MLGRVRSIPVGHYVHPCVCIPSLELALFGIRGRCGLPLHLGGATRCGICAPWWCWGWRRCEHSSSLCPARFSVRFEFDPKTCQFRKLGNHLRMPEVVDLLAHTSSPQRDGARYEAADFEVARACVAVTGVRVITRARSSTLLPHRRVRPIVCVCVCLKPLQLNRGSFRATWSASQS